MTDTKYNGWKNYETWCVSLWLNNEQGSYSLFNDRAEELRKEHGEDATEELAKEIESYIDEFNPAESGSVYSDLLNSSLSQVDYHEIADGFLEDFPIEEEETTEETGA